MMYTLEEVTHKTGYQVIYSVEEAASPEPQVYLNMLIGVGSKVPNQVHPDVWPKEKDQVSEGIEEF
jgi:hypothetical protein